MLYISYTYIQTGNVHMGVVQNDDGPGKDCVNLIGSFPSLILSRSFPGVIRLANIVRIAATALAMVDY